MRPDPELMPEPRVAQPDKAPWFQRWWAVLAAALLLWGGIFALVTANNGSGGQNVKGTVQCANGPVTGVFIEAERAPRVPLIGIEVQSGFASWHPWGPAAGIADFKYWLPFGGKYSVHFGCGSLADPGSWASDNRTPVVSSTDTGWMCLNPETPGTATVVVRDCVRMR